MFTGFPTNTVVLILGTMLASGATSWYFLSQGLTRLSVPGIVRRRWLLVAAILLAAWLLIRLGLAVFPPGGAVLANQFRITFISLGYGLFLGIGLLLISPLFRQIVRAIPETWLIGMHTMRIAGFLFLALMDMELLPAQFALSAGYGDMAVGLLAPVMIYLLSRRKPYARALVVAWNGLGLLDFVAALTTGGIYIVPFAARLAESGISLDYLNYVLVIPSFGIPLYALMHVYSLYQMLSGRAYARRREVGEPVQAPVSRDKVAL